VLRWRTPKPSGNQTLEKPRDPSRIEPPTQNAPNAKLPYPLAPPPTDRDQRDQLHREWIEEQPELREQLALRTLDKVLAELPIRTSNRYPPHSHDPEPQARETTVTTPTIQETSQTKSSFHFHVEVADGISTVATGPIRQYHRAAALALCEAESYAALINAVDDPELEVRIERSQLDTEALDHRRYRHRGVVLEWSVFPDDGRWMSARVISCQDSSTMNEGQVDDAINKLMDRLMAEAQPNLVPIILRGPAGSEALG
jgi:hypothetical protein